MNKSDESLNFLTLADKYLHLVEIVSFEITNQGNLHVLSSDKDDIDENDYEQKTRWSDFRISIPILFNLYHGIELSIKGLLLFSDGCEMKNSHNIEQLFNAFKDDFPEEEQIISILNKYLEIKFMNTILKDFLGENNFGVNNFYESLRYPVNKKHEKTNSYYELKYKPELGLVFFKEVEEDVDTLRRESTKFFRKR